MVVGLSAEDITYDDLLFKFRSSQEHIIGETILLFKNNIENCRTNCLKLFL